MKFYNPKGKIIYRHLKTNELVREDGRIERVCEHGIGHPIGNKKAWDSWTGVHGCDGCCSKAKFWLDNDGKVIL